MNKPDQETLDKLAKKRQYKLRGVLYSFSLVNNSIGQVIIAKGTGSNKKFFAFTSFGSNSYAIEKLKTGYRMKVWFTIKSQEYSGKWYTNLVIESFEHWEVNEDKVKKMKRIKEIEESQVRIDFKHKTNQF